MGNTVRTFSSLGTGKSNGDLEPEQETLGEALDTLAEDERLGDFLANRSDDDGVDPVEAVRDVREDV
ncbi:hypothetical protein [Halorussus halobius]|uniref:hypothetical protein n=1 Tax=Halorussus halobius TaxID=1710537 RepID=UPI0010922320|nr:hypothetical protein [Halorussus halobius]